MNKLHNRRPFGKARVNRWVKRFTHKRYRKTISQAVKAFTKRWNDYKFEDEDVYLYVYDSLIDDWVINPDIYIAADEPHLPQWKDINDPWTFS